MIVCRLRNKLRILSHYNIDVCTSLNVSVSVSRSGHRNLYPFHEMRIIIIYTKCEFIKICSNAIWSRRVYFPHSDRQSILNFFFLTFLSEFIIINQYKCMLSQIPTISYNIFIVFSYRVISRFTAQSAQTMPFTHRTAILSLASCNYLWSILFPVFFLTSLFGSVVIFKSTCIHN